mgnify:FL=1
MEQSFDHLADAVRLPESSRARIRTQIASHRKEQEASTVKQPKKHLPRLAVAAIIIAAALTLTAAAAAVIHQFRNDILISDLSEIPEPTGDTPMAVAVAKPASSRKAPKTLAERLADGPRFTMEEWRNGEKIDGWDHAELISDDPALCIRRITRDEDGAEKMQYMAADPADLLPVLTGKIRFDLTWLAENYKTVIPDDQAFIIRDADGNLANEFFWASYGANDGKGWVRLEIMYDTTWNLSPAYIMDGSFEEAYYYTTANGCEFLITADGDTVWASCTTAKTSVSLYGAYLTTSDLEQIVEHLSVSIAE